MDGISRGHAGQILASLRQPPVVSGPEGSRITVNETVGKFSFLYERIRNAVDYKDEHLHRKAAIERILKRQLILESEPGVIADRLVRELIAARYLPNGILPESIIDDVARAVRKFLAVSRIKAGSDRHANWLLGIIAVEIEEILVDASGEKALVTFLYERLADRIRLRGAELEDTERRLQVYVAGYRSLVKADDDMLGFKLLRAYLPEWLRSEEWIENPRPIAERLVAVHFRIRGRLNHVLAQRFLRAVKPSAVSLSVLQDVLHEAGDGASALLENAQTLKARLTAKVEQRYAQAKAKLRRGTVRAMIYLFITKMLVALLLEVPIELLWYQHVGILALMINLLFPPLVMLFVGLLIRVPGQENTDRLNNGVMELLSDDPIPLREIKVPAIRRGMTGLLFGVAYATTFLISFGLVGMLLKTLNFTWISSAIFIFFLCVVSFFGFRLRLGAREVVVVESKQSLFSVLIDFLSLPILRAGRWLSRSISRLNVFLFVFDFLFEAPFKIFLTVLEEWFAFMKEKREELH
ncbi:MAG: hypothetical protein WC787_00745 [Patescibacteria group bacterium]|jgi:hypothetical protein